MPALGLYSVCSPTPLIDNYEGTFLVWFQFALFESSSEDKISFSKSSWLDEFSLLKKGSMVVLDPSYGCSISFLLKLVQCL